MRSSAENLKVARINWSRSKVALWQRRHDRTGALLISDGILTQAHSKAVTAVLTTLATLISRLTPIGDEIAESANGPNYSVNSRPKNCGGYTVGICPSDLKICVCKSTTIRCPR